MAILNSVLLTLILVLFCFVQSLETSMLLSMGKDKAPSLEESSILSALHKGTVNPPSAPSDRGNSVVIPHGNLFSRQLGNVGNIVGRKKSTPSPGDGH